MLRVRRYDVGVITYYFVGFGGTGKALRPPFAQLRRVISGARRAAGDSAAAPEALGYLGCWSADGGIRV